MRSETHMLIVLGEDIGDYALQGYKNGACEKGNELKEVSATVTRYEAVLSDVTDRLVSEFFAQYGDGTDLSKGVSKKMYLGAVAEFLYQHGAFSHSVADRYPQSFLPFRPL